MPESSNDYAIGSAMVKTTAADMNNTYMLLLFTVWADSYLGSLRLNSWTSWVNYHFQIHIFIILGHYSSFFE